MARPFSLKVTHEWIRAAPRWIAASHRFWLGLTLIGAGGLSFETVEAAPIRKDHLSGETHEAALSIAHHNWAAYLAGGPSVWAHVIHPPVTPAVESAIWKAIRTDPGETSPWIQFLVYKQELDPAIRSFSSEGRSRARQAVGAKDGTPGRQSASDESARWRNEPCADAGAGYHRTNRSRAHDLAPGPRDGRVGRLVASPPERTGADRAGRRCDGHRSPLMGWRTALQAERTG